MSIPSGRLPRRPRPARSGNRSKPRYVWAGVIAAVVALAIIGSAMSHPPAKVSQTASVQTPPSSPSPSASQAAQLTSLSCQAHPTSRRPRDHSTVRVRIRAAARAQVRVTGALSLVNGERPIGRASATGTRTVRFRVGGATPGVRLVITVHVARNGSRGTCRTSFRPRPALAAPVAAPAQPAPAQPAAAPSSVSSPPPPASCYPLSDEGTCYEPGEFCRDSDHGATGLAGDGEKIICEDNDGWRWEPA
jgi:hypothetical protein